MNKTTRINPINLVGRLVGVRATKSSQVQNLLLKVTIGWGFGQEGRNLPSGGDICVTFWVHFYSLSTLSLFSIISLKIPRNIYFMDVDRGVYKYQFDTHISFLIAKEYS